MSGALCGDCGGEGFKIALVDSQKVRGIARITCSPCQGSGRADDRSALWVKIGATHRTWRVSQHEGLAACAERLGFDDRDLCDMEHGRKDPAPLLADIPEVLREHEQLPAIHKAA